MSLSSQNIEDLIALCRGNNQSAQFEIYKRYSKAMFNVALRIIKDEHYAEDVMQEGFLKAFLKIKNYRQEVAFGAWLKRIIVNQSIEFYKKNNRFSYNDFEESVYKLDDKVADDSDETDFTNLKANQVLEVINGLKESYRMVLTLFFIDGYDNEEISTILNISDANCRTTISRAKESLRKKLAAL